MKKTIQFIFSAAPLLLFTVLLAGLLMIRLLFDLVLPGWGGWGLGIAWGVMLFDYLLRAELFKQIGGFAVTLIAVLILAGALLPKETVARYPQVTSTQMVQKMESAWTAVYSGNIFKDYSLKQQLIDYGTSLGNLDPFRHGKMILYAALGFLLAVVYLFPVDPFKRGKSRSLKRAEPSLKRPGGLVETEHSSSLNDLNESDPSAVALAKDEARFNVFNDLNAKTTYIRRFLLLFSAGAVFALHVELLQVLTPSRLVTFGSFVDSTAGLLAGLLLFMMVHSVYLWLAHFRAKGSPRFNVLGVGVDAVCMADCMKLFESLIETVETEPSSSLKSLNVEVKNDDLNGFNVPAGHFNVLNESGRSGHRPAMTTALGVAGIIEARRNQKLQRILNESVLNTPDGMPLVWLGKLFGYRSIDRVYGPDLLRDACAYGESRGWRHYFWGAAPGIVEKLQEKLEEKHPQIEISGICCPPFRPLTAEEEDALVEEVNASDTDIFWIGISTPKQLYFMDHIRSRLNCKIICPVGYAFDVNAGVEEDAPDWAKYSGFQWLHRAIRQPRLWKRYLPDNPRFVFEVALQVLHLKKYPMLVHERVLDPYADAEGYSRFPAGVVSLSAMTLQGARDRVLGWVASGQKHYVNICTADTMVQCYDRPDLAKIVMNAGMATTDGMPLVWLAHHYGFRDATRVYGPDLMLELCRSTAEPLKPLNVEVVKDEGADLNEPSGRLNGFNGFNESQRGVSTSFVSSKRLNEDSVRFNAGGSRPVSHFFYGATDEVLAQLKANLLEKFPDLQIAGMYSPPFRPLTEAEKDEVTERINDSGADIVWCGLGTPKQDYWVAEFRPRLTCAAILAVGAAFNFHAGHVKQAPRWVMRSGLEWLFRLGMEPRRLWRRYLIGNPRFVCQVAGQIWYNRRHRQSGKSRSEQS